MYNLEILRFKKDLAVHLCIYAYVCLKKRDTVYLFFKARYEHMFLNAFHLLFNDKDSKRHNCFRQFAKSV